MADEPTDNSGNQTSALPPPVPPRRLVPVWNIILGACLWSALAGGIYLQLPRVTHTIQDFGVKINPLTDFLLRFSGFLFPVTVLAAWAWASLARSRPVWSIVLLWLPIILGITLTVAAGLPLLKVLNDLS